MDDRHQAAGRPTRDVESVISYVHARYRRRKLAQRGAASLGALIAVGVGVVALAAPSNRQHVRVSTPPSEPTTSPNHIRPSSTTRASAPTSILTSGTSGSTAPTPGLTAPPQTDSAAMPSTSIAPPTSTVPTTTTTARPRIVPPSLSNFNVSGGSGTPFQIDFSYTGGPATCVLHNGQSILTSWPCVVGANSHSYNAGPGNYDLFISASNASGSAQTPHASATE